MFDPISAYCVDYGAKTGVGFCPLPLPPSLVKRKCRDAEKRVYCRMPGDRQFLLIDVYFTPDPDYEALNQEVVDALLRRLDL